MLNDHEQEALREVQRRFDADDPTFAQSFEAVGRNSHSCVDWAYQLPRSTYTLALIAAVAVAGLMIVARAPWAALLFVALTPIIAALRRHSERPDEHPEPPSD